MVRVNINGESYKVRNREVNGKEQQIYYKDGEAYIKEGNKLKKLRETKDGIFSKAQYETAEYQYETRKKVADYKNRNCESGNAVAYTKSNLYDSVNKTVTIGGVTGVIKQNAGNVNDMSADFNLIREWTSKDGLSKFVRTFDIVYDSSGNIQGVKMLSNVEYKKDSNTGEFIEHRKSVVNEEGKTTWFIKDNDGNWVERTKDKKPEMGV